jgi:hypothetical protein
MIGIYNAARELREGHNRVILLMWVSAQGISSGEKAKKAADYHRNNSVTPNPQLSTQQKQRDKPTRRCLMGWENA